MGLALKPSKTRITHTLFPHEGQVGFDFLGYEIRQYPVGKTHSKQGFKTIIKPSKEAQTRHTRRIREVIKAHKAASQAVLIDRLNPIIRGWANYYSNACSKATYTAMDNLVYLKLRAWARRRHPEKNRHWIAHKYWLIGTGEGWVFAWGTASVAVTKCHKPKSIDISRFQASISSSTKVDITSET